MWPSLEDCGEQKKVKKNLRKIDDAFFMSEDIRQKVLVTISQIEKASAEQADIDTLWNKILNLFYEEMDKLLNPYNDELKCTVWGYIRKQNGIQSR